jgi:hypothetical protein
MGADEISISNVRMAAWSMVRPDAPQVKRVVVRPSDDPDPIEELARLLAGRQWMSRRSIGKGRLCQSETGPPPFSVRQP